jgi:thiol-disulfide isomerase/thioredoxin
LGKDNGNKDRRGLLRLAADYRHPLADSLAGMRRAFDAGTIGNEELATWIGMSSSLEIKNSPALEAWIEREGIGERTYGLIKGQRAGVGTPAFDFLAANAPAFRDTAGDDVDVYIFGRYMNHLRRRGVDAEAFIASLDGYPYSDALRELVLAERVITRGTDRTEYVRRVRDLVEKWPVVSPVAGLELMYYAGRHEPLLAEFMDDELAPRIAERFPDYATEIARYIARQYHIAYGDFVAVNHWVDRYLAWSGDPNMEQNFTALIKRGVGELECADYGKQMPDFVLKGVDGEPVSTETLRGEFVLIDFWASWCGPCKGEVPHLKEAYAAFKGAPLRFVSITCDRSDEAWLKGVEEMDAPWLHLSADGTEMLTAYGVRGIPRIMVLDPEGRLVADMLSKTAISAQLERLAVKFGW